jgi:hypothetical protein
MKTWGIIATVFLIASLFLNAWYYYETTHLNTSIKQQNENLGLESGLERDPRYQLPSETVYQLPFETMYELRSNANTLVNFILEYRMQHSKSEQEHGGLGDEKAIATTTHDLTISINGQGSISPSEGTHEYPGGTQVTVNVSAISGWEFDHWSGDATGTSPTIVITMDSDKHVTAYFDDGTSTSEGMWCSKPYGCG